MRSRRLLGLALFYLFYAILIAAFAGSGGLLVYIAIIGASLVLILALRLDVPRNGFLAGGLLAAAAMGLLVLALRAAGLLAFGPLREGFAGILLAGIGIQLIVATGEELALRAVVFGGLREEIGSAPATLLSAAGFAALHLPSMAALGVAPATGAIALATIFVAGLLLALLYDRGGIGSAIAFHFAWNYAEYHVFGLGPLQGAITVLRSGPDYLTGGAYGPEASVAGLATMVLLTVALWLYYEKTAKKRGPGKTNPAAAIPARNGP